MKAENIPERAVPAEASDSDPRLQVSALVDGELDDATIERTIDALLASDELAAFWADAHRAGDWMRSEEVIGVGNGELFLRKFSVQLASEPTILAPRASGRSRSKRFWIRTGLPGASVAAALVVVAWVAMPFGRDDGSANLAKAQPTVLIVPAAIANAEPELKEVDPERLSDYFAAHRDVTPFGYRGAAARPAVYATPVVTANTPPSQ